MKRVLKLTLSKKPFDIMITGEKNVEIRKPSEWIKSRLLNKDGSRKKYDLVKFTNGYGTDKPFFTCDFLGFYRTSVDCEVRYSTMNIDVKRGDIIIRLGDIHSTGNIKGKLS